jgi:hypothetical protein
MIQPHELIIGAILEYNIGTTEIPDWHTTKIDSIDIRNCEYDNEVFNKLHRGIPLTEKILVEWKIAEFSHRIRANNFYEIGKGIMIMFDNLGRIYFYCGSEKPLCNIATLHQLQMLIQALTNQPLKIELK